MSPTQLRRIVLFLASQTVSMLGSSIVGYAVMWHIVLRTGDGSLFMWTILAAMLPQGIMSLFGGVWADRYSRKGLIIGADAGIAVITAALAIIVLQGEASLALLIIVLIPRSIGGGIQQPTVAAVLPQLVPETQLMRVNSINMTLMSATFLVSPALAAALLTAVDLGWILLIDVVTALIAITIFAFIPVPRLERSAATRPHLLRDWAEGLSFVWHHGAIRRLLIVFTILSLVLMPPAMLAPIMAVSVFDASEAGLAAVEIVYTVGMMVGGAILAAWGGLKNRTTMIIIVSLAWGVFTIGLGLTPWFWLHLVVWGITGLVEPGLSTTAMTALQERVPATVLGRVMGLLTLIMTVAAPLGTVVAGPLIDVIGARAVFVIFGAIGVIATLVLSVRAPALLAPTPTADGELTAQS